MTAIPLREDREEAVPPPPADAPPQAGARGRASSVPPLPSPAHPGGSAVAVRDDSPSPLAVLADRLASVAGASLLHARPPSLHSAWQAHRDAAARWDAAAIRYPRYAFGIVHVAVKGAADLILVVSASPAGLVLAAILVAACWLWL